MNKPRLGDFPRFSSKQAGAFSRSSQWLVEEKLKAVLSHPAKAGFRVSRLLVFQVPTVSSPRAAPSCLSSRHWDVLEEGTLGRRSLGVLAMSFGL